MKKTHPSLFLGVFGIALVHVSEGIIGLIRPAQPATICIERSSQSPHWISLLLTVPFLIIGLGILYGLFFGTYKTVQRFMLAGFMYVMFYAVGLLPAFGLSLNRPETWLFIGFLPPFWFWAFTHFIAIKEPPVNPTTAQELPTNGK